MTAELCKILPIKYPIIMAPMFLVSSPTMVRAALDNGITAAIPASNFRKKGELAQAIDELKKQTDKPFGINLIVNKSNRSYKQQLEEILKSKPAFIITSLGNPKETIEKAHAQNIKVFCDVVDLKFAKKVESLGADLIIAVNSKAGGHSGIMEPKELMNTLKSNCKVPIIYAGGIATNKEYEIAIGNGAAGVSIGTIFIASNECEVSLEYKNALIKYGKDDIVLTRKLSGAPTAVINTPYVQSIGTKPNLLENLVNNNSFLKKIAKTILTKLGMSKLQKAAFKATYKTVWCAGVSIEHIHEIKPISKIIYELTTHTDNNNFYKFADKK